MITAVIISLIAVFLSYLPRHGFQYGLEMAMLILTVFVAIRYEWGTDMPSYLKMYNMFYDSGYRFWEISKISDICYRQNEIGWGVLNILCKPIGFFGMTILLAVIENYIIYDTIRRYVSKSYYWLAIFLYTFNANLMVLGCSMMRQWLSMCIILLAIRQVLSGNIVKFLFLIILASLSHQSAIVFSCLYLVRFLDKKFKVSFKYLPIVLAVIFSWVFIYGARLKGIVTALISSGYFDYQTDELSGGGASVGIKVAFLTLLLLYCIVITKRKEEARLICWMSCAYILLVPFAAVFPLASRLLFYAEIIAMISISSSMRFLHDNTIKALLIVATIILHLYSYNEFFKSDSYRLPYQDYKTILESPTWM